jgi:endonuclease YncB( thermonuclease family)
MKMLMLGLLIMLTAISVNAYDITGKVIRVADGDTFTLLSGQQQTRVRLYCIDAPESGQDFSKRAKQLLSNYIFGKKVSVTIINTDQYDRKVGVVQVDGQIINLLMVQQGMAWVYRRYCYEPAYYNAQREAKKTKSG